MKTYSRSNLLFLSITLNFAWLARADFEPIALTSDSFNQDVVVEKTAPPPIVPVTTASMDGGISNSGFTWFERGYNADWPATGLPKAGSILTSDQAEGHQYQMPFSYQANNALLIDAAGASGVLSFTTPTNFGALSFLTSSGTARDQIQYTVHFVDGSSETGKFTSPCWLSDGEPAWAANGRVDVTTFAYTGLNSYNPRLYSVDVSLSSGEKPILSVELALAAGAGHTAVFAISGAATIGGRFVPVAVAGYNQDMVVEASALHPGFLDYNTSATMDNGTANTRFTWYERGYYGPAPQTGLPQAGSVITSEADAGHRFLLPPSYTNNNAVLLDALVKHSILTLVTPACYSALSFLTASGHGPVTNRCVLNHSDGTSETNSFVSPDWLGDSLAAFTSRGRVSTSTKLIDRVGTDSPRLYAVDMSVANGNSPVTNIDLSLIGAGVDAHAVVFALSGTSSTIKPLTRPILLIASTTDGHLTIRSTQPGRLQSSASLSVPNGAWKDEGPISQILTLTPALAEPLRFYRVVAP